MLDAAMGLAPAPPGQGDGPEHGGMPGAVGTPGAKRTPSAGPAPGAESTPGPKGMPGAKGMAGAGSTPGAGSALGQGDTAGVGPGGAGGGAEAYWRVALRAWAVAVFEQMCAHPWALEVAVGVRPLGPNEVGWFEAGLAPLGDSGLSGAERLDALALLSGHARSLAQQVRSAGGRDLENGMTRQLGETLAAHADRYPATIAAFAESDAPGDRNNALHFGIDRILDGLGVLISRHRE
ncbi:TetR family transcriptional regulator [Nocardia terpenica]|uniref:TetR family transcriptional regulator n=2 Tax=Nocardia terpenica TaxID=455432 RepID=A0A291RYK5_9NOCA|nr:TetR family transcriptional regulator [Nocardia terpenica]